MPITDQYINYMYFEKLKNLNDIRIDFSATRLTAIMGVNGCGKSTILHALSCCYKPLTGEARHDFKFSEFFTPNTHANWIGSKFTLNHRNRNGILSNKNISTEYSKQTDRWSPKYNRRPEGHIEFIGINTCVPDIESESSNTFIGFDTQVRNDNNSKKVKELAGYILGKNYSQFSVHNTPKRKKYIGVACNGEGQYSSLSMGAGEQRVFRILEAVINSPKHSLILIDEVDLLLHINSLKKLIAKLFELANEDKRKLQIVFTTHSLVMNELTQYVGIRYISQTPSKTLVSDSITTDSIYHMTGTQEKPIKVYVEDVLSQAIVNIICEEINSKRYVETFLFGAAVNSFTVVAGIILRNEPLDNIRAVIDGDVYKTSEEKLTQLGKVITGQANEEKRTTAKDAIIQYSLPEGFKPERWIRELVVTLPDEILSDNNEVKSVLRSIDTVDNDHKYVDDAISRMGDSHEIGLYKIIKAATLSEKWADYVAPIQQWILSRVPHC